MPKYDFKCPECDDVMEFDHPDHYYYCIDDEAHGHNEPVKMNRVYNFGGFVLKGPGFYKTGG